MERLIRKEGLDVQIIDIGEDKKYAKELVDFGGKMQIPCLDINGKALYESKSILSWLEEHAQELK